MPIEDEGSGMDSDGDVVIVNLEGERFDEGDPGDYEHVYMTGDDDEHDPFPEGYSTPLAGGSDSDDEQPPPHIVVGGNVEEHPPDTAFAEAMLLLEADAIASELDGSSGPVSADPVSRAARAGRQWANRLRNTENPFIIHSGTLYARDVC